MKSLPLFLLLATAAAHSVFAGPGLGFQPGDTVKSALERQVGQRVELHLKSGEKAAGKVEKVGEKAVHLSALTGQEYFEAMVLIEDVSAIVVRLANK
jgi:hypothetical protein